jgi:hypothetical protein
MNLVYLVSRMTPRQLWQLMLDPQVCGTHMVQWVPTPKHPLFLRSVSLIVLLETLSNNALASSFRFQMFSAVDHLVVIVSDDAFVVLKYRLDVVIKDILQDNCWS